MTENNATSAPAPTATTAPTPAPEPAATPAAAPSPAPSPAPAGTPPGADGERQLMFNKDTTATTPTAEAKPDAAGMKQYLIEKTADGDKALEGKTDAEIATLYDALKQKEAADGNKEADKPIEYKDFNIPEEVPAPKEVLDKFKGIAAKHKLSQEAAQEFIDLQLEMNQRTNDDWVATKGAWKEEFTKDPTYGGANLQASLKKCDDIVRRYGDEALVDDLFMLGLGNKLSFGRFLNKIADATANDSISDTEPGGGQAEVSVANKLWPAMK